MRKALVVFVVVAASSMVGEIARAGGSESAPVSEAVTPSISGRVTDSSTGVGLAGVRVLVYTGGGSGLPVEDVTTDGDGFYATEEALTPGDHWVQTKDTEGYIDEVHDDIPCPNLCNAHNGTPVSIESDTDATVDFELDAAASISGMVASASDVPSAIADAEIRIYDGDGHFRNSATSGLDGSWDTGAVLPAGTYFARVEKAQAHYGELYDSIDCPFWPGCDETGGTPIVLAVGETRTGIDFELDRGATISGTVTETLGGSSVTGATIAIHDANGNIVSLAETTSGAYTSADALVAGTYYVRIASSGYWLLIEELYEDIWCPAGCDVTTGTPVPVAAAEDVVGIDFSLERFGAASGRLIAEATGQGIPQAYVHVFDLDGDFVAAAPDWQGYGYWVTDRTLLPGEYYARSFNPAGYFDLLYDGIECDDCDVTTGTRFTVEPASTASNIDFVLPSGGTISGTVFDSSSMGGVDGIHLEIFSEGGTRMVGVTTDSEGDYTTPTILASGNYFVKTVQNDHWLEQIYDGVACEQPCSLDDGSPVAVTVGSNTPGIDFVLVFENEIFEDGFETGDLTSWIAGG